MSISEQVKELRELSEIFEGKRLGRVLGQAADTTEALSAKLAAANMERSDRYYGGGCENEDFGKEKPPIQRQFPQITT